ncbi:MAG TPA: thioredoxin family protein, partial [Rhodocyclaceae bacterium]|nr:thioredoxin family protein [Rhodocyclaceae bacterium]
GVLMLLYGGALLIGTLSGGRDPLQPLQIFAGNAASTKTGAPLAAAPAHATPYLKVATRAELDQRLQAADKPVMLDFYADWCVSCKEMERFTMSDPAIRTRLDSFLLLQVDVTNNTAEDAALLKRFGLYGPPGMIFFSAGGRELASPRVIGFQSVEVFAKELDRVLTNPLKTPVTGISL